jgi:hypothetical protein
MAAEQHGSSTKHGTNIIGHRQQHKGKKVETTIHHAKEPQLSVRVSMIESLNEEMRIKLSSLTVFCSSSSRLLQRTEKRSDPGICVLWGPLTECDWQENGGLETPSSP